MYFNIQQLDQGLVFCEANGRYTVEELHEAARQLTGFITLQDEQEVIVILDLRTATMPTEAISPSMWTSFFKLEHPAIRGYVLIGKSMYLGIYGNLIMRLFNKHLLYARTIKQAHGFARELMNRYFSHPNKEGVV